MPLDPLTLEGFGRRWRLALSSAARPSDAHDLFPSSPACSRRDSTSASGCPTSNRRQTPRILRRLYRPRHLFASTRRRPVRRPARLASDASPLSLARQSPIQQRGSLLFFRSRAATSSPWPDPSATRPETPIALLAPRTRSRYSPQKPATNISGAYDFNPAKDGDLFGLFDCEPMDNGDVADVDPLSNNDEVASACSFIKTLLCNLSSQAGTSDKFLLFVKKPPDHADALSKHIYDLRVQAV